MKKNKSNIILFVVLAFLMIIAIIIGLINPTKKENTLELDNELENEKINETIIDENISIDDEKIKEINEQEEKVKSMEEGGTFAKINDQIIWYDIISGNLYNYNLSTNECKKLIEANTSINKVYFDGENVFYIPGHYIDKGIYKVDLQGNLKKIYEEEVSKLLITDYHIYFVKQIGWDEINSNPQGTICSMDKDGNDIKEIVKDIKNNFFIRDNKIYYTTLDRKMYSIKKDGTEQEELTQGRRFILSVSDKYLTYIDYASQEAKHVLNLETKEDVVIGYFGEVREYQGKTYINVRTRLEDGALTDNYTLFEVKEDGSISKVGEAANFGTDLNYIANSKVYIYNKQENMSYIIDLISREKIFAEEYNNCRYYFGGYGYLINSEDLNNIKINRVEL